MAEVLLDPGTGPREPLAIELELREDRVEVPGLEHGPVDEALILGREHAAPPVAPVRRVGAVLPHQTGIEDEVAAVELGRVLAEGIAAQLVAEERVVAGRTPPPALGVGAVRIDRDPAAIPELGPPGVSGLTGLLQIPVGLVPQFLQPAVPVLERRGLRDMGDDAQVMAARRLPRREMPGREVSSLVGPLGRSCGPKAGPADHPPEGATGQVVRDLLTVLLEALLPDQQAGEQAVTGIAMMEVHRVVPVRDGVLAEPDLARVLVQREAGSTAIRIRDLLLGAAPVLVRSQHVDRVAGGDLDMNDGSKGLGPDLDHHRLRRSAQLESAGDLDPALAEDQLLAEGLPVEGTRSDPQPHAPQLEVLAVLGDAAAPLEIDQQLAVLDPDVEPDVVSTGRHRLRGVPALLIPDDVVWRGIMGLHRTGQGRNDQEEADAGDRCLHAARIRLPGPRHPGCPGRHVVGDAPRVASVRARGLVEVELSLGPRKARVPGQRS